MQYIKHSKRKKIVVISLFIASILAVSIAMNNANEMVYAQIKNPAEPIPMEPKDPNPIPKIEGDSPCFTIVSDTTTKVDKGNTVVANYYSGWPIIAGATYIWSSNGLNTSNPYTFTKDFALPAGNAYYGIITINADDAWKDLRINGNHIADESPPPSWASPNWPPQSWSTSHKFVIPSNYFNVGLNTLSVKAVDIGGAFAGLAFKLEIFCKNIHWDKIVFRLLPSNVNATQQLKPFLGKTLDIKVIDNPMEVAVLEDVVKEFLASRYDIKASDLSKVRIDIRDVEYAIADNPMWTYIDKPMDLSIKPSNATSKKANV